MASGAVIREEPGRARRPGAGSLPLCIDLDDCLVKTDLLVESYFALLKQGILQAFKSVVWLLKGRAHFKAEVASRVALDPAVLPFSPALIDEIHRAKSSGRTIVLATAADQRTAHSVADHLGFFDEVVCSEGVLNLTGRAKLKALEEKYGERGFDYAGNDLADFPIWRRARAAIAVNPGPLVRRRLKSLPNLQAVIEDRPTVAVSYAKAMRPHQWLKNILVFVPLVAAQEVFDLTLVLRSLIAFFGFSMAASSAYVLNDLLDLSSDRAHPRKRDRPFASGAISARAGAGLMIVPLSVAALTSFTLPGLFALWLAAYFVLTVMYSVWLKAKLLVDVMALAGLYTLRVIAGAAAIEVIPSFWLLGFSLFLFLSLAMIKRYAELLDLRTAGGKESRGRGYRVDDLGILASLGTSSGYVSVVVLALFVNSEQGALAYGRPEAIWLICPILAYWVARMWIITARGKMHDDPLVYAVTDRVSRLVFLMAVAAVIVGVWPRV